MTKKEKAKKRKQAAVRRVAMCYYVVQYAIVHLLFFGFVIDPVKIVPIAVISFNWAEIANAALNFSNLIMVGITFQSALWTLPYLIWYSLVFVWAARYLIIYLFVLISLIRFTLCLAGARRSRKKIKLNKQAEVHEGAPGTGKTWSLVLFGQILARLMWMKLSWLHWRDKSKVDDWVKEGNQIKLQDWIEVKESYAYYTKPQRTVTIDRDTAEVKIRIKEPIKCLFSNIGIEQDGKMSSRQTLDHATVRERPPSYTISVYSEIGTTFSIEYSTDKQDTMSDDLRHCRQRRENVILGDEQEATNMMKNTRRVLSDVIEMDDCKIILQPFLLNLFFKPLKWLFSKTQICSDWKHLADFMTSFERFINMTGFVRFKFHSKGGTEHTRKCKRGKFISPMWNTIRYDTRAFRFLNNCRGKRIKGDLHDDLSVPNTPENRLGFLSAEVKNRPKVYFNTNEKELLQYEDAFWSQEAAKDRCAKYRKKYPDKYAKFKEEIKLEGGTYAKPPA